MSILKKSTFAALLLMLLTTLFSCELNSEDGRWDPMKWTSNRPGDPRKITATAEGGTYQLKCTNMGDHGLITLHLKTQPSLVQVKSKIFVILNMIGTIYQQKRILFILLFSPIQLAKNANYSSM